MAPLRHRYANNVEQPQDNTYGLPFYSRLLLRDPTIRFLLQEHIPSLRTIVVLPGGEPVTFHWLHPRPPHPGHSSAPGDSELVMAAREVTRTKEPTVVAGDLRT